MSEIDLIEFWFEHPELWFKCSNQDDLWITNLFGNRVRHKILSTRNSHLKDLEDIILLDQISRHVDRVWNTHFSTEYHSECLQISQKIIKLSLKKWLPQQICFLLMPLRHSKLQSHLEQSLDCITLLIKTDSENSYYRRFYYANLDSLIKFILPQKIDISPPLNPDFSDILCSTCKYQSILESLWDSKLQCYDLLVKSFSNIKTKHPSVVISLSGGVDSMVSSFILKKLNFQVSALMINYQNREESTREVEFVSWWCYCLKIPFRTTTINYLSRTQDRDRSFYEKFTNKIRFQSYRELGEPIILGHNMDDCLENILSNIKTGKSFDNLVGMETESFQQGVLLLRPILNIRKSEIFKFAHNYNIPYIWDSTPKWSQRGKYRDYLIPSIEKYETALVPSLLKMSERYHHICKHYYQLLEEKLEITKLKDKNEYIIRFINCYEYDYWRFIFEKCFQLYQLKIPSHKSITHLISILKSPENIKGRRVMLTKGYQGDFSDINILRISLNEV